MRRERFKALKLCRVKRRIQMHLDNAHFDHRGMDNKSAKVKECKNGAEGDRTFLP